MTTKPFIIDSHLDLAWNALTFGRDYLQPVAVTRQQERGSDAVARNGNAMNGLPEWRSAGVALLFATLYAAPASAPLGTAASYETAEEAHTLYRQQLHFYHRWVDENPESLTLITTRPQLEALIARHEQEAAPPVGLILLMEGADGIRTPEEAEWWADKGVRMIGPAWSATRYAGGTAAPGPLTPLGEALLDVMGQLGLILDLSHLSDEGIEMALDRATGPLMASHCAARGLLPASQVPERHLSDAAIRAIAARDGVIGLPLGNGFLLDGWIDHRDRRRVTLAHVVDQIDYLCDQIGDTDHVGIGSDFDGGFGLESVPIGLESSADLPRIGDALADRGYSDASIYAIFGGNWRRFLRHALPAE
ncbi:MAG: membrane dipeptidase [Anaerolineales bacterium]|nr:membrane dipeptidase [Anaerolineales bacterium]MCB9127754.1 membrane dipeptidase [Ardenticatenales bacterium]